jgi:hypothetical protein
MAIDQALRRAVRRFASIALGVRCPISHITIPSLSAPDMGQARQRESESVPHRSLAAAMRGTYAGIVSPCHRMNSVHCPSPSAAAHRADQQMACDFAKGSPSPGPIHAKREGNNNVSDVRVQDFVQKDHSSAQVAGPLPEVVLFGALSSALVSFEQYDNRPGERWQLQDPRLPDCDRPIRPFRCRCFCRRLGDSPGKQFALKER